MNWVLEHVAEAGWSSSLDGLYATVSRYCLNCGNSGTPEAAVNQLAEVVGYLLPVYLDKGRRGADASGSLLKAVVWWLVLCRQMDVKSVEAMVWRKYPYACPYCLRPPHDAATCGAASPGKDRVDWRQLEAVGEANRARYPRALERWAEMTWAIHPPNLAEDRRRVPLRLAEELSELIEAVRARGNTQRHFSSEAPDVFVWLMRLQAPPTVKQVPASG
jgi:hypothetical protein